MPIMDENDVSLPKATLSKMIREFMPSEVRLAGEAMDMIIECCTEFVSLVSSEANDVSGREKRNTIHPDHVIKALQELGLQEFVEEVTAAWDVWKEESKCRPAGAHKPGNRKTAADAAGLSEEEQIALQQQLFAAARRSFQVPDLNNEARTVSCAQLNAPVTSSSDNANMLSCAVPAPQFEIQQEVHGNRSQLPQHLGASHTSAVGLSQVPSYQTQQPRTGVYQNQTVAYNASCRDGTTGYVPTNDGIVEAGVVKGSGYVALDPRSEASAPTMSGYGSDVLPIPPLLAQPMPSAFHPSSSPLVSGPSLGVTSHSQACELSQGNTPAGIALSAQQCMLLVQPSAIGSQAISSTSPGSQRLWTTGSLPEIQLSQPVVVIHNGVQHMVSLQTLLSQVGGFQEYRVEQSSTSPSGPGPGSRDGRFGGIEGQTFQAGSESLYKKREEQLSARLDEGLYSANVTMQPSLSKNNGETQLEPSTVLRVPDAGSLPPAQYTSSPRAGPLDASKSFTSSNTTLLVNTDHHINKLQEEARSTVGDVAQVDTKAVHQLAAVPAFTPTSLSGLEATVLPAGKDASSHSPPAPVLHAVPVQRIPRQGSGSDQPVLEHQTGRYSSLHVPLSSGLEPTLDGRSAGKNSGLNQPAMAVKCEKVEYLSSSPSTNPGNPGVCAESCDVLKRAHSDGPGGASDKLETVDDEPPPLRRKTQMSQEVLCEPT